MTAFLQSKKWLSVGALAFSLLGAGTVGAATGGGGSVLSAVTGSSSTPVAASATSPAATATATAPTPGPDSPTATAVATASSTPAGTAPGANAASDSLNLNGGAGANNVVHVVNHTDGRLKVRGSVELNQIHATNVGPENLAYAYGSCTDCQTFAVALQVNLYNKNATRIVPKNAAIAVNFQCTRCTTVAVAYQYAYGVDDPSQVPQDAKDLIRDMNHELTAIQTDHSITLSEAESRIQAVVDQFQELAPSLDTQRQEATDATSPGATPLPGDTITPGGTSTPEATTTSEPTASTVDTAETATATPVIPAATGTPTPQPIQSPTPQTTP